MSARPATVELYHEMHGAQVPGTVPLLLIHGGGSTIGTNFGAALPLLSATRRIIAVELMGHGHTPAIDRPNTFDNSADDLASLLDRLDVARWTCSVSATAARSRCAWPSATRSACAGRSSPRRRPAATA